MTSKSRIFVAFVIGVATVPALLILGAWLGVLPVPATSRPPGWEDRFAEFALDRAVARSARDLAAPIGDDSQTLLAGLKIYRNNCAGCHGDFEAPSHWGTKNFYPRVPQFAEHAPHLSVPEMYLVIKQGIRYSGMGAWDGMMPDKDIWRVALFLGRLESLPSDVGDAWRKPPKP